LAPRPLAVTSRASQSTIRAVGHKASAAPVGTRALRAARVHVSTPRRQLTVRAKKEEDDEEPIVMMEAEVIDVEPTVTVEAGKGKASSSGSGLPTVVMPGDYRIGATLLTVSVFLGPVCHLWWPQFFIHGFLGAFLAFQASRVRFRFSDKELDVVFVEPGASDDSALAASTTSSGDNKLQGGGANAWSLEAITNWEFWWPGFPVLVYYKENQTRAEGQPHFFPIIMDGKKLYETMLERMPASKNAKVSPADWNLLTALEATPVGRNLIDQLDDQQKAKAKSIDKMPFFDK